MEEADSNTTLIRINVEIPVNNSFCQYKPHWGFQSCSKRSMIDPVIQRTPRRQRLYKPWLPVLFRVNNN